MNGVHCLAPVAFVVAVLFLLVSIYLFETMKKADAGLLTSGGSQQGLKMGVAAISVACLSVAAIAVLYFLERP